MVKIYREEDIKISKWSGGVTKQLFIYPEDGDYSSRNFRARLSIATTEEEESVFTKLEEVDRIISVLEGKMEIIHKEHYSKILNPYEIDHFKGEWDTFSKGKVTDFNLMLKKCGGDFFFKEIKEIEKIQFEKQNKIIFVYCISGEITIENEIVKTGELLTTEETDIILYSKSAKIFYGYIK